MLTVGLLVGSGASVSVASAVFVAATSNSGNTITAAQTFPDYPTAVKADNPFFYHRMDDAPGSVLAADSSGNNQHGVHAGDGATRAAFLAPFDEGSGSTVKDLSGVSSTRNLTATNMTWEAGKSGTAGAFNGTSSYAASSFSVLTTTASFSVSAWVYLTAVGGYRTAVSQDGTNVSRFFLQYDHSTGKWRFTLPQSDSTVASGDVVVSAASAKLNTWTHLVGVYIITSGTGYLDGNWHHVVATASAATGMRLHLDGALVGERAYPGTAAHTGAWRWGGDTHMVSWPSPDYFNGHVDEVAVYGAILSAQQVAWHYHANH